MFVSLNIVKGIVVAIQMVVKAAVGTVEEASSYLAKLDYMELHSDYN